MLRVLDLDNTRVDSDLAYGVALSEIGLSPDAPEYVAARARVKERLGVRHVAARNRLLYLKDRAETAGRFGASAVLDEMERYERALEREVERQWRELGRDRLVASLRELA